MANNNIYLNVTGRMIKEILKLSEGEQKARFIEQQSQLLSKATQYLGKKVYI